MRLSVNKSVLAVVLWAIVGATMARADHHLKPIANCTTITEPGSYVVTKVIVADERNLPSFGVGFACILIAADFVTLDLQGHPIIGPGAETQVFGVFSDVTRRGITVRNGAVTNFAGGVVLAGGGSVEGMRAIRNNLNGFTIGQPGNTPNGNRVIGNTANENGRRGILVFCPAVIVENVATENQLDNITLSGDLTTCTRSHNSPRLGDVP